MLALWYYHSEEGLRFLQARDTRAMLTGAGVLAAYVLLCMRRRFSHQESRWRVIWRLITSAAVAAVLWVGFDFVRGEDWIAQLSAAFPNLGENGVKYLVLIVSGWLGWSVAIFEGLRWFAIVRHRNLAEPVYGPSSQERGR